MPATHFTKRANTPRRKRMWEHVYEQQLDRGLSKGKAIRSANAAVKSDTLKARKGRKSVKHRRKKGG